MRKLILGAFLVLSFFSVAIYATNISTKLNKVRKQLDRAALYAVNCDMDSQVDKKIHATCIQANLMLQQANVKLERLAAITPDHISDISDHIKQLKIRIRNINEHLTAAKIVSGDYDWSNSFIPSIKP